MAILIPNNFSSYNLTDDEVREGSIYTITQLELLQNDLAAAAEEKLVLEFDTTNPQTFIQQEAFKRGQIELLRYIIDRSLNAVEERSDLNPEV